MSKPKIDRSFVDPLSAEDRRKVAHGIHAEFTEVLDKVSPSVKKTTTLTIVLPESKPEQVEELLLSFAGVEIVHKRLSIFFRAAQGACLLRLREAHGHHNKARHSASCGVAWEGYIKAKFGFSDDKAARLIKVWQRMEPLLTKLSVEDRQRVLDFLRRPMILLPPAEAIILEKITHKISDAEAEYECMLEDGFIGLPHGHALKNAKHKTGAAAKTTPEQYFQDELWLPIVGGGDGTLPTVWEPFDKLIKAWNAPVSDGAIKAPGWQFGDEAKKRQLKEVLETQMAIRVTQVKSMIAQLDESMGKKK